MLSQTSEYALRAVIFLAMTDSEEPVKLERIAESLEVPRNYLSKTLHLLARAGVLGSGRGKRGGFWLAIPADELTLAAVVEPFEASTLSRRCLLGHGECSDETACAVHDRWKPIAEAMRELFGRTTVGDLLTGEAVIPSVVVTQ